MADLALRQQRASSPSTTPTSAGRSATSSTASRSSTSRSAAPAAPRRCRCRPIRAAALHRGDQGPARAVPNPGVQPREGRELLDGKGWAKNGDGIWAKDGTTLDVDIISFAVMADIGPVIAEQLRQQGVDASFAMPPDASTASSRATTRRPLRPRRQRQRRSLLHAAALPVGDRRGARRPPGQLLPVAQRRVRQDRRRDGRHADRDQEA